MLDGKRARSAVRVACAQSSDSGLRATAHRPDPARGTRIFEVDFESKVVVGRVLPGPPMAAIRRRRGTLGQLYVPRSGELELEGPRCETVETVRARNRGRETVKRRTCETARERVNDCLKIWCW